MKKVARLRISPTMADDPQFLPPNHHSNNNPAAEPIVRTTGRIKKPKAVFDPSDNYLPRAQRPSIAGNAQQDRNNAPSRMSTSSLDSNVAPRDVCVVCSKRESKRTSFASKNPLMVCVECEGKIHRQCLKVDVEDFDQFRRQFKCERCAPCTICSQVGENRKALYCRKCTKLYHCSCLPPKTYEPNDDAAARTWLCPKCAMPVQISNGGNMQAKKIRDIIGSSARSITPLTSSSGHVVGSTSASTFHNSDSSCDTNIKRSLDDSESGGSESAASESVPKARKVPKKENVAVKYAAPKAANTIKQNFNEDDDDMPDVREWTVAEVYDYFKRRFPKDAHVFRDHEIDGNSLLLLKRSDVVKKLPLKLGPALRIYSIILQIQNRTIDPTLGWNCGQ